MAIVGHGRGQHKNFNPDSGSSIVSAHGLAQIQINAVGHGFGPLSTLTITRTDGSTVTLPAGGRGFDQDGDGQIGVYEGSEALPPYSLRGNTDAMVQTVADLMHIVRMIQGGVDVDGERAGALEQVDRQRAHVAELEEGIVGFELDRERRLERGGEEDHLAHEVELHEGGED